MAVDLHVHTTASDGTLSPTQIVTLGLELGLHAIAITDHDTVEGLAEGVEAAAGTELEVISAIELSALLIDTTVHLLLYYVDTTHSGFLRLLARRRRERRTRLLAMLDRLAALGVNITIGELLERSGRNYDSNDQYPADDLPLGRAHIAYAMVAKQIVSNPQEAFDLYIGQGKPAYLPVGGLQAAEVLSISKAMGSVSSVAHPGLSLTDRDIEELAALGLNGIEAIHSEHTAQQREHYEKLAAGLGLIATGGSDCHGPSSGRKVLLGGLHVPDRYWIRLREAHSRVS